MDPRLNGSACVVTGASAGIGLATARLLCAQGASVLLVARRAEPLVAAARACAEEGGRAETLAIDVTAPEAADRVLGACAERFGGIDVLVNNAGASSSRPLNELHDEEWQAQWELNVLAPMRLMREAAPRMAQRAGGRIVNVASSSGKRPGLNNAASSVTKSAQLSLSRVFADAYARAGVLVTCPGQSRADAPGSVRVGGDDLPVNRVD
jgi:NAD(P)-dependent dehydrogenase (short-subunit alcohol dehydrogenase family)